MGKFKEHFCYQCDGTFRIKHDMDDSRYEIKNCVFCGSELDDDEHSSDTVEYDSDDV